VERSGEARPESVEFRASAVRYFLTVLVPAAAVTLPVVPVAWFWSPRAASWIGIPLVAGLLVGSAVATWVGLPRAVLVVSRDAVTGPSGWYGGETTIRVNRLDRERSRRRSVLSRLTGWHRIRSRFGATIVFNRHWFPRSTLNALFLELGMQIHLRLVR
jgi:hypothetical protein